MWLEDNFEITKNQKDFIKKTEISSVYKNDHKFSKKTTFYKYMEENGYVLFKLNGYEGYRGLKYLEKKKKKVNLFNRDF